MMKSRYEDTNDPQQNAETVFESEQENEILSDFCNYLQEKDPDIIVFVGDYYANTILDYLFARTVKLALDLQVGREKKNVTTLPSLKHPGTQWFKGVDLVLFH
jgi:DNA polymerase elongation subunit (family B)